MFFIFNFIQIICQYSIFNFLEYDNLTKINLPFHFSYMRMLLLPTCYYYKIILSAHLLFIIVLNKSNHM